MAPDVVQMLDPEFVVPSPDSLRDIRFWLRADSVARNTRARLGPETLNSLNELAATSPAVQGLPQGDFWKIFGKFVSRVFTGTSSARSVDLTHLADSYSPNMGAETNSSLLVADLGAIRPEFPAVLVTTEACWPDIHQGCERCETAWVYPLPIEILRGDEANWLAPVHRSHYLTTRAGDLEGLEAQAKLLFPSLVFADTAWNQLSSLKGSPQDIVRGLMQHLSVLNDHALDIWDGHPTTESRQAVMSGEFGVTVSPESSQTHKNSKSMRLRTFRFDAGPVKCEWHTKLRPEVNRIHFAIEDGQVFVGTIVDHLPL